MAGKNWILANANLRDGGGGGDYAWTLDMYAVAEN